MSPGTATYGDFWVFLSNGFACFWPALQTVSTFSAPYSPDDVFLRCIGMVSEPLVLMRSDHV